MYGEPLSEPILGTNWERLLRSRRCRAIVLDMTLDFVSIDSQLNLEEPFACRNVYVLDSDLSPFAL